MVWRRLDGLAIAGLALVLFALPARADDWEDCNLSTDSDVRISACSAIIDAGTDTAKNIAITYSNRGFVYDKKGDHDRAIENYDRSIALNPEDPITYGARSGAYYAKGDYRRAFEDEDRTIGLNPKDGLAYLMRGSANEKLGNTGTAIADYRKALELRPGDVVGARSTEGLVRLAP